MQCSAEALALHAPSLLSTLLILLIGLAAARLMAGKLALLAIPAIVVELLIGFLLGNSVLPFDAVAPLSGLTELGVLALFFQVGLEVRGDLLASRRATVLRLVGLSLIGPLLGYWPLVQLLGMTPAAAVLCLACTAATGTGVTLRLLAQRQAIHSPSGRLLVAVSVLDDLPAIGLLSLAVAMAGSRMAGHGHALAPVLGLLAAALSDRVARWWRRRGYPTPASPLAVLILLVASAWAGEISGLTSLLGALWGGVLLNRLSEKPPQVNEMLRLISEVFLPLYFISVGLRVQASDLLNPQSWGLSLLLLALALLSKLVCGFGISRRDQQQGVDRWVVIFGLIPRGLPGLVFATTALSAGVIDAQQFSAVVVMVTLTTVVGLLLLERRLVGLKPAAASSH